MLQTRSITLANVILMHFLGMDNIQSIYPYNSSPTNRGKRGILGKSYQALRSTSTPPWLSLLVLRVIIDLSIEGSPLEDLLTRDIFTGLGFSTLEIVVPSSPCLFMRTLPLHPFLRRSI